MPGLLERAVTIVPGLPPGLRVWRHGPSKGIFLPVQDPKGRGGNPGKPLWCLTASRPSLAGPSRQSLGVASAKPQAPVSPTDTRPFFHPRQPRGGRGTHSAHHA